ncbi:peptidase M15 [mine drainage metagenome]|uniref:Murein endopeptidase K n=1 Tax=mine drainage metagenome TaxID=410659 RepID=A0A1J5R576_9ZZZZ
MLSRRNFLALTAAASASTLIATPAQAALRTHMERIIHLHNIHTGESLRTVYWHDGRYRTSALRQLNHLLRDHYSGAVHVMDPHVIDVLAALQHRVAGNKPLQIVSGYRTPQTNAMLASLSDGVAQHSLHMEGKAVDIRVEGVSVHHLGRAAKSLHAGGVGQYPASNFVHVDVGRVRYW